MESASRMGRWETWLEAQRDWWGATKAMRPGSQRGQCAICWNAPVMRKEAAGARECEWWSVPFLNWPSSLGDASPTLSPHLHGVQCPRSTRASLSRSHLFPSQLGSHPHMLKNGGKSSLSRPCPLVTFDPTLSFLEESTSWALPRRLGMRAGTDPLGEKPAYLGHESWMRAMLAYQQADPTNCLGAAKRNVNILLKNVLFQKIASKVLP